MQTRTESIAAPDGERFDGYVALPDSGTGPGMLVLQEIFGVNAYIRDVCARLAEMGYVAMAPDVFWRLERNVELGGDDAALEAAYGYIRRYDWQAGIADLVAALDHLRAMPETGGRAGAIGFCFGGTTSFALACRARPDVVVSYYGSGVPDWLAEADGVTTPVLFHFGTKDPYIANEAVDAVRAWASGRANVEVRTYDSGHAFDNHRSAKFSDPVAAAEAWEHTTRFLQTHLPVKR
ncbi:MAG TPA: dienelactone hydrolase family protein [Acidimicrobiales bacterium]